MRSMRDSQLPEPYRSWIDRAQPLPGKVRLLPRAVRLVHDTLFFAFSVPMLLGVAVLVHGLFGEDLARAEAFQNSTRSEVHVRNCLPSGEKTAPSLARRSALGVAIRRPLGRPTPSLRSPRRSAGDRLPG